MSLDATRWAWGVSGIRPAWKLVLLSLADRAGEACTCWPSLGRLAADTGLDVKTVRRALNELCGRGLIRRSSRPGRGYIYTLSGVTLSSGAAAAGIAAPAPPKEAAGRSRKRQAPPAANGSLNDQQPVTNPQDNPEGARAEAPCPEPSGMEGPAASQSGPGSLVPGKRAPAPETKRDDSRRQALGEFGNVRLSPGELAGLEADFGPERTREAVALLDLHLGAKKGADPYKSHYLAMRKWVFDALWEREARKARLNGAAGRPPGGGASGRGTGPSGSAVRTFQQQAEASVWAGFDRLLADAGRPGGNAPEHPESREAEGGADRLGPGARSSGHAGAAR